MNRGYVRLWRKSLDAGWIKNHKLWAFWSYCLMKASHKEYDAIVGLQVVHLIPGQFIFGRRKASEETGLTEREIRTIIAFLINCGNLTIKTTNKYSIITIVNWHIYQPQEIENDQLNDKQMSNKGPHTKTKEHENKKTPADFFEIKSLEERYSDRDLINQCYKSISSTRKTNRISESVKLNILQQWDKYPADQVMAAIRIYLEKDYAGQGKDEKYLMGIIRGNAQQKPVANIPGGKVMKRTGSLLDKVYQEQGFTLI
jgi:hypothetical protein